MERTRVGERAAGVIIGRELRINAQRGSAERDDADRTRDLRLEDRGVLIDEEVEVAVSAIHSGRTRDGVSRAGGEKAIDGIAVRDDSSAQRKLGVGEGDIMRCAHEAPAVGHARPRRHGASRGIIAVIARGDVTGRGDVGASEARSVGLADAGHAPGVGIGGEGRAGVDGPAADDAVDHAGGVHRGTVDVGEVDQA